MPVAARAGAGLIGPLRLPVDDGAAEAAQRLVEPATRSFPGHRRAAAARADVRGRADQRDGRWRLSINSRASLLISMSPTRSILSIVDVRFLLLDGPRYHRRDVLPGDGGAASRIERDVLGRKRLRRIWPMSCSWVRAGASRATGGRAA
jgi:hypothetical protein